jgi:hypothetical protein
MLLPVVLRYRFSLRLLCFAFCQSKKGAID